MGIEPTWPRAQLGLSVHVCSTKRSGHRNSKSGLDDGNPIIEGVVTRPGADPNGALLRARRRDFSELMLSRTVTTTHCAARDAQAVRWSMFETSLSAGVLDEYLGRLP